MSRLEQALQQMAERGTVRGVDAVIAESARGPVSVAPMARSWRPSLLVAVMAGLLAVVGLAVAQPTDKGVVVGSGPREPEPTGPPMTPSTTPPTTPSTTAPRPTTTSIVDRAAAANIMLLEGGPALREAITSVPQGASACGAEDLYHREGFGPMWVVPRPQRRCFLVDYPSLRGRLEDGTWVPVDYHRSPVSAYSDGGAWTGFMKYGALLSVTRGRTPEPKGGVCQSGTTDSRHFTALALVFPGQAHQVELPYELTVGPCRPSMSLWAFDHTQNE